MGEVYAAERVGLGDGQRVVFRAGSKKTNRRSRLIFSCKTFNELTRLGKHLSLLIGFNASMWMLVAELVSVFPKKNS